MVQKVYSRGVFPLFMPEAPFSRDLSRHPGAFQPAPGCWKREAASDILAETIIRGGGMVKRNWIWWIALAGAVSFDYLFWDRRPGGSFFVFVVVCLGVGGLL